MRSKNRSTSQLKSTIPNRSFDSSFYQVHKDGYEGKNFGLNNTSEILEGEFGIYSTTNTKERIGPIKTQFFSISLVRSGSAMYTIDLETFYLDRNLLTLGRPGQVVSLDDTTEDLFAYYMMFTEGFMAETVLQIRNGYQFPFYQDDSQPCIQLDEETGNEVERLIHKIEVEVKTRRSHYIRVIGFYIHLILIIADRNYAHQRNLTGSQVNTGFTLSRRFIKAVNENFLLLHKVSDYAKLLNVSPDHLNRNIKIHSGKTAHEFIENRILIEAKVCLLHSTISIAEIAYNLGFSDPSNFAKFIKRQMNMTPLQYRNKSEQDHLG